MSQFEGTQVQLTLVNEKSKYTVPDTGQVISGKEIHRQMNINRVWKNDEKGKYAVLMYNAMPYIFRLGHVQQVPKTIGTDLIAQSAILIGKLEDALTNPQLPFLVTVREIELGTEQTKSPTACPECTKECDTFPRLARHTLKEHPESRYNDDDEEKSEPEESDINAEVGSA